MKPTPCRDDGRTEGSTLVVFLTHVLHDHIVRRYEHLAEGLPADHDLCLAVDAEAASRETIAEAERIAGENLYLFRFEDLRVADYPRPWAGENSTRLVPGNSDLLFLHLHRTHGAYSKYWLVEHDVAYTGDWGPFFEHFEDSDSDLLGTTLHPHRVLPEWHWWDSVGAPGKIQREALYRGFFPLMRISSRGLEVLDRAYTRGWTGHHEVVLPTAFNHFGLEIEDVGGSGPFVCAENDGRFYSNTPWRTGLGPGSFIYRPPRRWPGIRRNTLWHPVKPTQGRLSQFTDMLRDWIDARLSETRGRRRG